MRLFAVRVGDTQEPVGFFWVRSIEELADYVDGAVCDPSGCEYKAIDEPTMIVWPEAISWKMGVKELPGDFDDDLPDFDERIAKAFDPEHTQFGSELVEFVDGYTDVKGWKKLPSEGLWR